MQKKIGFNPFSFSFLF